MFHIIIDKSNWITSLHTHVYQGQNSAGSFRLAPVSPEHGMKWTSFLGLNPTFFKNGTSFSLHSSYLHANDKNIWINARTKFRKKQKVSVDTGVLILTSLDSSSLLGHPFCLQVQSNALHQQFWPTWHALASDLLSQSPSQTLLSLQRSPLQIMTYSKC